MKRLLFLLVLIFGQDIAASAQYKLKEDFSDFVSPFPSAGWTRGVAITTTGNPVWSRHPSGYAQCNFFNWTSGTDSLVSPIFSATTTNDSIYFDIAYRTRQTQVDRLKVYISSNAGASWTLRLDLPGGSNVGTGMVTALPMSTEYSFIFTSTEWKSIKAFLPAGINRIKFETISANGNNLFLDNIKVGRQDDIDVGLTNLLGGYSGYIYYASNTATFDSMYTGVQNYGVLPASFSVTRKNNLNYSSTKTVTNLAPGASAKIYFDSWSYTFVDGQSCPFTDSVSLVGDTNPENDKTEAGHPLRIAKDILVISTHVPSHFQFIADLDAAGLNGKYDIENRIAGRVDIWKTFIFLTPSPYLPTFVKDSCKAFINRANNPLNKKSLAFFSSEMASYVDSLAINPGGFTMYYDTTFFRQYFRTKYLSPNWQTNLLSAGRKYYGTAPFFQGFVQDSIGDPVHNYDDILFPSTGHNLVRPINGGLPALIPKNITGTDTAIAVYYNSPSYKTFYGANSYISYVPLNGSSKSTTDIIRYIASTSIVVPVSITSVNAYELNNGITVKWNTANETNMKEYEVEYSNNGTSFTKIGAIIAKSGLSNSYLFHHLQPITGNNYYRIKAVGKDADIKYSAIVKIELGKKVKEGISIYPNPIKDNNFTLLVNNLNRGEYSFSLRNSVGQLFMTKNVTHSGGNSAFSLVLENIPTGVYYATLISKSQVFTQKIMVE